ncbi:hypothetical protein GIB67_004378 [Kingdonia uniflora]|uniref:Uncharacterized protein n=1 Tax=Kingdonia uniflora TaxID=39325 RepID=A0A7J7MRN7_9MAGN|nr:hypothetical protein GIB67_004378 [Kingdonia uniflora]
MFKNSSNLFGNDSNGNGNCSCTGLQVEVATMVNSGRNNWFAALVRAAGRTDVNSNPGTDCSFRQLEELKLSCKQQHRQAEELIVISGGRTVPVINSGKFRAREMRFEESALTRYLVRNLQPLTEADPVILAEYVAALLKKDKPIKELEKLCTEDLVEFLGQGTRPFIIKLFQALEEGSLVTRSKSLDTLGHVEASLSHTTEDHSEMQHSAEKLERLSSGSLDDGEENDVTDDDDADRNHKHRRRETRPHSFEDGKHDEQQQLLRRPNRKRSRPFESGQMYVQNDPQSSESHKEGNSDSFRRNFYGNVGKRRPGLVPYSRTPFDVGMRTRGNLNPSFHGDFGGPSFDSQLLGRPLIGRGRGRIPSPWGQHDSKFSSVGTLDLASQIASLGPTPPSLFAGRGLQPFGLIRGMPNGSLEPLHHPFGLQGPLGPPVNPSLSIGKPRQLCRDFEELGYCLSGDMCPMEHGVNRIVVEDVQSLSKFNLPVLFPSSRLSGTSSGTGHATLAGAPSSLLTNSNTVLSKSCKPGKAEDHLGFNGMSASDVGEADLYDPDQPLWSNDHGEMPRALMGLSSPLKNDEPEPQWNANPFDSSQSTSSAVWGRRVRDSGKFDSTNVSTGYLGDEVKEDQKAGKLIPSQDVDPISIKPATTTRRNIGRTSQKASRTLFVNGVPLKNNKRDILLSHFQKFGEIIDVYIPANSEKAFVQFSKREEAEAALMAPDAVMGNRFIKLWWANRDNVPDGTNSLPPQSSVADKGKENLHLVTSKASAASTASAAPVSTSVNSGPVGGTGPKAKPSSQKKLELLKEELRLKQEMLDQKRNAFRRQLDKLEKQVTVKGEASVGQIAKGLKLGTVPEAAKSKTLKSLDSGMPVAKSDSGENIASPNLKTNLTTLIHSPKNLKQTSHPSTLFGASYPTNRFKLDNRPTTFRILPPLPADLADVHMLKEHFSSFGDLSAVELEQPEGNAGPAGIIEQSKNYSARITFATRRSAERAISNGICWQGRNLQFSWLKSSNNSSSNGHSVREKSPVPKPKGDSIGEHLGETATPISTENAVVEKIEEITSSDIAEASRSSNNIMSPCETLSPTDDL